MSISWSPLVRGAAVVSCGLAILVAIGCQQAPPTAPAQQAMSQVERGRYLVSSSGCNDCHTPMKMGPNGPEPDMSRFLSGHPEAVVMPPPPALDGAWMWVGSATNTAFAGPWGITYAPNLTPDEETGIGAWTEDMFVGALKHGKQFGGGRPILPPMPWQAYSHLSDEDLKAMFAYLKTLPPIVNHVPDWQPPQGGPGDNAGDQAQQ